MSRNRNVIASLKGKDGFSQLWEAHSALLERHPARAELLAHYNSLLKAQLVFPSLSCLCWQKSFRDWGMSEVLSASFSLPFLLSFVFSFFSPFLFFFLKFIYFNWRIITLQHCDDFCHTSVWIGHRYACAPLSWTPSHCSPHPTPPGCHRAAALGALLHAPNLQWLSILILYVSILCSHGKP